MSLEDYVEYFERYERNKIYNVLSLEISNTKYVFSKFNDTEEIFSTHFTKKVK
jgi:hypothetical protein